MKKQDNRTPLRKAVDWLISEGKLTQDKDLQEIFGLKKSTISAYLTGKPGKRFVNDFQKQFGLSLEKFEKPSEDNTGSKPLTEAEGIEFLREHIADLRKQIEDLKADKSELKKEKEIVLHTLKINLDRTLSNQHLMLQELATAMRVSAERYAGNDKKKLAAELEKIRTMIVSVHAENA